VQDANLTSASAAKFVDFGYCDSIGNASKASLIFRKEPLQSLQRTWSVWSSNIGEFLPTLTLTNHVAAEGIVEKLHWCSSGPGAVGVWKGSVQNNWPRNGSNKRSRGGKAWSNVACHASGSKILLLACSQWLTLPVAHEDTQDQFPFWPVETIGAFASASTSISHLSCGISLQAHLNGKRYRKAKLQAKVESYDFSKHEPHIVQHKKDPQKLFCHLTKTTLNKVPEEVRKRRYLLPPCGGLEFCALSRAW